MTNMTDFVINPSCSMELQPYTKEGFFNEVAFDAESCKELLRSFGVEHSDVPIDVQLTVADGRVAGHTIGTFTGTDVTHIEVAIGIINNPNARFRSKGRAARVLSDCHTTAVHEFSHVADMLNTPRYLQERARHARARYGALSGGVLLGIGSVLTSAVKESRNNYQDERNKRLLKNIGLKGAIGALATALSIGIIHRKSYTESPTEKRAYQREGQSHQYPTIVEVL